MKSLKILIVEDEILIAELIKDYVEETGHEVIDMAISYEEAVEMYFRLKPDLILLDIRLYGPKSGIDFAKYLETEKINTPIVFLSSQYDQRTLGQALETNPYGYLTKPVSKESLSTTISAAYSLYEANHNNKTIELFDGKKHHIIKLYNILYIEADHVYLNIFFADGKYITIRQSLKQILSEIPQEIIIRCHRSYLVNKNHIKSWGNSHITLYNNKEIPVSKNFKEDLSHALKNHNG